MFNNMNTVHQSLTWILLLQWRKRCHYKNMTSLYFQFQVMWKGYFIKFLKH